jgi:hypothetical protein
MKIIIDITSCTAAVSPQGIRVTASTETSRGTFIRNQYPANDDPAMTKLAALFKDVERDVLLY